MRKIIICAFLTLDGVRQAPGGPDEDTGSGFEHGGWQNSTLLEGDTVDAVRALKASDGGNINLVGSGDLAQTLMRHGLVDEYRLTIHPVIIGTGKRLFADGAIPTALEPVSVSTTKGGTVVGVYRPNGKPSYDSY
ncbi:dihydrofolate reductase family protein [Streptomyces litmocidini]|uniref:dihydrofolate reductase family protein n=1 Tax=Streptomyces litmocidini TaxID=67318 RepID=UPI0033D59B18